MTKEFEKAIMQRSKLRNKFLKYWTDETRCLYKTQINLCVALSSKDKKNYFNKSANKVVSDYRKFWKTVGPNFAEKAFHKESIILKLLPITKKHSTISLSALGKISAKKII